MKHLFYVLLIIVQSACAQTPVTSIEGAYSKFESDTQLKYGLSSLTVLNAKTGEVIFSKNGNIGLAPASTLKTVTSISAFHILGKNHRWETTLGYSGSISNGVLNGDIIISGSGDPTLGSNRYEQTKSEIILKRWTAAITKAGIRKVNGRIVGDDSLFGTQITPLGWIWQDIGNYYGAGATSLSWKENEIGVRFNPGARPGDAAKMTTAVSGLKIVNEVTTGAAGSGDNVYAYSAPYTDVVYLRGTYGIDLKKTVMIAMPDPALSLSLDLSNVLESAGIDISAGATTVRLIEQGKGSVAKASKVLDTYSSPSLPQVIYWLNQKSLNLYAENFLKTIALKQGKKASTENGVEQVQQFWKKKLDIDPNALAVLDGSGLSPENRVTTTVMASIMQSAVIEPWYDAFYSSLPLYNDMKMKSGSIRNVLAYTGYQKSGSGTPYVFTFITNNYSGSTASIKQKMFKVLDQLK